MMATEYLSFLVRLWREGDPDGPAAGWHGELEHIQTSQRRAFHTVEGLLDLLRQATEEADGIDWEEPVA